MTVYVFRHIPMEHLGRIGPALENAGIAVHYFDLYREPVDHILVEQAAGLIFLGGPMSVNDGHDYVRRELGLIESVLALDRPMLGVCLGSQLLARALGARVYPNAVKEIGWGPVRRTDAGKMDPLLGSFNDPETVLHWHGETFDLPAGATWLAFSEKCANQAFRYGPHVYGLQFHLEATPEMIRQWCEAEVNARDVAALPEPLDPGAHEGRMRELSAAAFGAWARFAAK